MLLKCSPKVATIVLISSTKEISISRPCELEKVLESLSVDNTSPCRYNDIKKTSTTLFFMGIGFLVANVIFFLLILNFLSIPKKEENNVEIAVSTQRIYKIFFVVYFKKHKFYIWFATFTFLQPVGIVFGVACVVAIGYSIGMLIYYDKIVTFKETYTDTVCITYSVHYLKTVVVSLNLSFM